MKTKGSMKTAFAVAAFGVAAAGTPACATVRQDVCYPVQAPPTVVYDQYGRPMMVPGERMVDAQGQPVMSCHTVYHVVPKSTIEPQ